MNETAAPERAHLPAECLRAEEIAGEVDGENRVPLLQRQRVEPARPQHRRGVDEHAARSERFLDCLGCSANALGAGGVAANDYMAVAELTQRCARHFQAALVTVDRGDTGTGLREAHRDSAADAATAARHHRDAA